MEENKKIKIAYSILVIILLAIICFLISNIIFDGKLNEGGNSNTNTNEKVEEDRTLIQSELDRVAREELYVFGGKKSINELNNDEKLWFSFKRFFSFSDESFKGNDLKKYYNGTTLANLQISHADISYYLSDCILYKYDFTSDTYNMTDECSRGASWIDYAYVDVSEYTVDGDYYTINVKYLWYYDEPADGYYLYGKYSDVFELDYNANEYNDKCLNSSLVSIHDNDSELKNILDNSNVETYTFTLKKTTDGFKLVNLEVK